MISSFMKIRQNTKRTLNIEFIIIDLKRCFKFFRTIVVRTVKQFDYIEMLFYRVLHIFSHLFLWQKYKKDPVDLDFP